MKCNKNEYLLTFTLAHTASTNITSANIVNLRSNMITIAQCYCNCNRTCSCNTAAACTCQTNKYVRVILFVHVIVRMNVL